MTLLLLSVTIHFLLKPIHVLTKNIFDKLLSLLWKISSPVMTNLHSVFNAFKFFFLTDCCIIIVIILITFFYCCFSTNSHFYDTEKKLLQSKLRKASASGKSFDINQSAGNKMDMSTSTEDLGKRLKSKILECLP